MASRQDTHSLVADDKKVGLTLREVAEWVQEMYKIDVDPDRRVLAAAGFKGQLQGLSVGG